MKTEKKGVNLIRVFFVILAVAIGITAALKITKTKASGKLKKHLKLGDRYLSEMKYDDAILAYNKALKIDKTNRQAVTGLGAAYLYMQNGEKILDTGNYIEKAFPEEEKVEMKKTFAEDLGERCEEKIAEDDDENWLVIRVVILYTDEEEMDDEIDQLSETYGKEEVDKAKEKAEDIYKAYEEEEDAGAADEEAEEDERKGKVFPLDIRSKKAEDNHLRYIWISPETEKEFPKISEVIKEETEDTEKACWEQGLIYIFQTITVKRNDNLVLSYYDRIEYTKEKECVGKRLNFDMATGEEILLDDIIKDPEAFVRLAQDYNYGAARDETYWEKVENLDVEFSLLPEGIELAEGELEKDTIQIPFAADRDVFKGVARDQETPWMQQFPVVADYNGDGNIYRLWMTENRIDDSRIKSVLHVMNVATGEERTFPREIRSYVTESYLLHNSKEENSVIMCQASDNCIMNMTAGKLDGCDFYQSEKRIEVSAKIPSMFCNMRESANPEKFPIRIKCDMLSTGHPRGWFAFKDGALSRVSKDYIYFDDQPPIRTKTDIQVVKLNQETREPEGETVIPGGEEIFLKYTDARTFMDVRLNDGTLVRIKVDGYMKHGLGTVNGKDVMDLFDNMFFAG